MNNQDISFLEAIRMAIEAEQKAVGFYADAACCKHIHYYFPLAQTLTPKLFALIYILLTSLPCFISDRRGTSLLGWLIIISAAASWIIYVEYFVSVWCFYAAVITSGIAILTSTERGWMLKR